MDEVTVAGVHPAARQPVTWLWTASSVIWLLLAIAYAAKGDHRTFAAMCALLAAMNVTVDTYQAAYQAMTGSEVLPGRVGYRRQLVIGRLANLASSAAGPGHRP